MPIDDKVDLDATCIPHERENPAHENSNKVRKHLMTGFQKVKNEIR